MAISTELVITIATGIGTLFSTIYTQAHHFNKSRKVGREKDTVIISNLSDIHTSLVGLGNRMDVVEQKVDSITQERNQ